MRVDLSGIPSIIVLWSPSKGITTIIVAQRTFETTEESSAPFGATQVNL